MMERKRVLLVGHTADWMEINMYEHDLTEAGFVCTHDLKLGETESGEYDLVVLCGVSSDLGRARMAVQAIEQLYPEPPILVLTGHREPGNIAQFATARTVVLSKMFSVQELVKTVGRLANTQTAPS